SGTRGLRDLGTGDWGTNGPLLLPVFVILRRGGVQFPPVLVALDQLLACFQRLVIIVLNAQRLADVVDDVLIGRRVVATWGLLAGEVSVVDVHVDVAGGDVGRHSAVIAQGLFDFGAPGARGRAVPVHVQG